eukprot:8135320-Alexandrium_andersonii.AAC.1
MGSAGGPRARPGSATGDGSSTVGVPPPGSDAPHALRAGLADDGGSGAVSGADDDSPSAERSGPGPGVPGVLRDGFG